MGLVVLLLLAVAPKTWTMTVAGDVMLNGVRPGSQPLAAIARSLWHSDVTIVNLEIPLTSAKTKTNRKSKAELKQRLQFILRADPAHAAYLAKCGIDAVGLGNNHAMDFGPKGLSQMTALLDSVKIRHTGAGMTRADALQPAELKARDGTTVALVSFATFIGKKALWHIHPASDGSAGVATLRHFGVVNAGTRAELLEIVAAARRTASVVVVALHGGVERSPLPTAYQVAIARAFVDAGADVVVGSHPHVLQGAELYRGHPIFYSVGNLISPLPGTTALFHLRFRGSAFLAFAITPCGIRGGKTAPLKGKAATAALQAFNSLCSKLAEKYPNDHAVALTAPYLARGK